jgi:uncharacterized protein (DUF433 family)
MISNFNKIIFMDTTLLNRITSNPKVLAGKPVIRGMRISVEHVIKMLARGIAVADIINEYPMLEADDIKACLVYAANKISTDTEIAA